MPDTITSPSPLGVCLWTPPGKNAARTVQYPTYLHEILAHAGPAYAAIIPDALSTALPDLRILVTVGETTLDPTLQEGLREWVNAGGVWVSIGGVCGLPDLFGAAVEPPSYIGWGTGLSTLGEGYLESVASGHPVVAGLHVPLHYFNGIAVRATDGVVLARVLNAHQQPTDRAAIVEKTKGAGRCLLIAPDLTGTVVRVQQGTAIACDGVPAPDGTAPVCDEVWKTDDGAVLDWILDRQSVPGVPGLNGFLEPVADLWREILLRAIFYGANLQGMALPLLWYYPRDLPGIAHMSHDTDMNDVPRAEILLQTLREAAIQTTWCTILPGYPPEIINAIREDGHELAMHYNALDHPWSEEEFDRQWQELTSLFDGERPITNKNHYLRWEGYLELYHWCIQRGIRLDQSKGASKLGEVGFNFGTCHPYAPADRNGKLLDIWELPTPTQDLNVFAPDTVLPALLDSVAQRYGILHLLFHPAHVHRAEVVAAIRKAADEARERGLEWWTARRIIEWEDARRQLHWQSVGLESEGAEVRFTATADLPGMTLYFLAPDAREVRVNGETVAHHTTERWGFRFQSVVFDAAAGEEYHVGVIA
jgi:hypothetical protein